MIIGITGTSNSGKDTVAKLLIYKMGWSHFSISDELRRIATEQGLPLDNQTLGDLAIGLRKEFGLGYLSEVGLGKHVAPNLIVTSLRNLGEIEPLRQADNFILIAIDAPVELRFERAHTRARAGEQDLSLEEFMAKEKIMMQGDSHGQRIADLIAEADYRIDNIGTLADLEQKIDEILLKVQ